MYRATTKNSPGTAVVDIQPVRDTVFQTVRAMLKGRKLHFLEVQCNSRGPEDRVTTEIFFTCFRRLDAAHDNLSNFSPAACGFADRASSESEHLSRRFLAVALAKAQGAEK
jgi:hypothetical protein